MFLSRCVRSASRIAVVTGGNKGIGYEVVRGLVKSKTFEKIYLTARNDELGLAAANLLCNEEHTDSVKYHQLDVTDNKSIESFSIFLDNEHGGLDVLVQNAGIMILPNNDGSIEEQAEQTMNTNFWGALNVMKSLADITKPDGRIVFVSSTLSQSAMFEFEPHWMINPIAKQLGSMNVSISMESVEKLAHQYLSDMQNGIDNGWPAMSYSVSKLFVNQITKVYAADMTKRQTGVLVNCCCPGFVQTDMTASAPGASRGKSPSDGAKTPIYLSLVPAGMTEPQGRIILDA